MQTLETQTHPSIQNQPNEKPQDNQFPYRLFQRNGQSHMLCLFRNSKYGVI